MTADKPAPLVPKLRFPEFRNAPGWSTPRGNTLFDSINNRSAAPGLPVLAITQEHGAIPRDQIDYHVSVTAESVASYKEVCEGDFIISLRSFQGGIEYSRYHGICSPAYVILRRKGGGSDHFFRHLFKSDRFIKQLTRNIEGIRDGKMVSYAQFSEQLLSVPEPPEQQKIADCLDSLDHLIVAEGRKLEALRQHKQGLMQQLFPQPGETLPRLRFPEFSEDGEWEETTIGDMGEVITGRTPTTSRRDFYGGDFMFVSPADISDLRFVEKTKTTLTESGFSECRQIKENSVLFVCIGSTIGKVAQCSRPCATNQQINSVITNSAFVADFAYYLLDKESVRIARLASKQAVPIINKSLFKAVTVTAPTFAEQQRIADCLSSLDARLAAQMQKLTALKTHKQGLLQQLFPSLESQ